MKICFRVTFLLKEPQVKVVNLDKHQVVQKVQQVVDNRVEVKENEIV